MKKSLVLLKNFCEEIGPSILLSSIQITNNLQNYIFSEDIIVSGFASFFGLSFDTIQSETAMYSLFGISLAFALLTIALGEYNHFCTRFSYVNVDSCYLIVI